MADRKMTSERLNAFLRELGEKIGDVRPILSDFRANRFREVQWEHAKRGWGGVGPNRPKTSRARSRRWGYYRNSRRAGVNPGGPAFVWTGRVLDATARFTKIEKREAYVDILENYAYPDESRVPYVLEAIDDRGGTVWDLEEVDRVVSKGIERSIRKALKKGGGI